MKQTLEFTKTEMNAMPCYIAEPYKVIDYDFDPKTGRDEKYWCAYHRIRTYDHKYLFGNHVDSKNWKYATKEDAMAACENHLGRGNNYETNARNR